MKITKTIYLFIYAATPYLLGRGGGCCNPTPNPTPSAPPFFTAKCFEIFFIDTRVSGHRVGKLTVRQS